jgi:glycosyltransferase involved in cell wall biosynthesis
MQILIDRLSEPWGIQQQVGYLVRAMAMDDRDVRVLTRHFDSDTYRHISNHVEVHDSPWTVLDSQRRTIVGPYPATKWIDKSSIGDYSILLSELPWGFYPDKQREWLGSMPSYVTGQSQLMKESLKYIFNTPVRKTRRMYNRWRHNRAVKHADTVFIHDNRLADPIQAIHDRNPTLIPPVIPEPRENNQTPRSCFLAVSPLEPARNLHTVIDVFYLIVRRYGARFQANWDSDSPFQSGDLHDFKLKIVGEGPGKEYLEDYAETQQLEDKIEFEPWLSPEIMERTIHSSLGVIDVPLTGDASVVPYQALASGVPTVYSRSHPGLDSFLDGSNLAKQVKPTAKDVMARFLIDAAKIPPAQRTPVPQLAESITPENNFQTLLNN